ncbi:MAG: hypothetical protein O7D91_17075 [Planctomycetota bacterium]|nr:hypothetical protein [Planctomycetota bacterium]
MVSRAHSHIRQTLLRIFLISFLAGLDFLFRYHFTKTPSYFVMDLALFFVLHSVFLLIHTNMTREQWHRRAVGATGFAIVIYIILGACFVQLHEKHEESIEHAFEAYKHSVALYYGEQRGQLPESARENLDREIERITESISILEDLAKEVIWMNIFFQTPLTHKRDRAEEIMNLLQTVEPKVAAPEWKRLYPPRHWLYIPIVALTIVIIVLASLPEEFKTPQSRRKVEPQSE